jgi:UDP-N-acetylenolpyruvoylglucosamine reductase
MSGPPGAKPDYPLERLTTIRTGGHADWFARPDDSGRLAELLGWAHE